MAPLKTTTEDSTMTAADVESKPAAKASQEAGRESIEGGTERSAATEAQKVPEKVPASSSKDVKWRAASRIVTDVPTEKLWAVAKDFCNLEWLSMVTACVLLHGEGLGTTVGTVRRCTNDNGPWFSDEKLVAIDHEKLTLTYAMVNSNLGWSNYQATLSIGQSQEGKSFVELRGEQSPRDNSTEQDAVQFMTTGYSSFISDLETKARTL